MKLDIFCCELSKNSTFLMKLNTKDSFENVSSAREIASAIALNSLKQCEILLKDLSDCFKPAHTTLQNKCFHQVAFIII